MRDIETSRFTFERIRRGLKQRVLSSIFQMEDIILPFKRGSMGDIEDMTGETEAAASQGDSQETQRIYEREAQLVIDYRRYLEKPLRSLDNEKEVRATEH